ncbi:MAG: gliding motility-associated C-terminal domain-containing protein [Saprospiraceae bacterium]|nr:gliding motility-associated C-terminal domain-containing protein [Saprospiraceae bacterium]
MSFFLIYVIFLLMNSVGAPIAEEPFKTSEQEANCDSLQLDVMVSPPLCAGQQASVTLGGSGGIVPYQYSTDGGLNYNANPSFSLLAGTYILSVQDAMGCQKDTNINIKEPPGLILQIGQDTFTAGVGEVINLLAAGSGGTPPLVFSWSPSQGLSCTQCSNPTVVAGMVVAYTVTLTDANGCSRSLSIAIDVTADKNVFVPNAFSPNFDGLNDLLQPYGSGVGVLEVERLQVWDRWGNLLWEGKHFLLNDPQVGWDGNWRGEAMDPAVFVYVMDVIFVDGSKGAYTGEFALIR